MNCVLSQRVSLNCVFLIRTSRFSNSCFFFRKKTSFISFFSPDDLKKPAFYQHKLDCVLTDLGEYGLGLPKRRGSFQSEADEHVEDPDTGLTDASEQLVHRLQ